MTNILLLHPGAMGASVGAALCGAGHDVSWVGAGRSEASRQRGVEAGLVEVADLATAIAAGPSGIVSVVPPERAVEVAAAVASAAQPASGPCWYLDANAIAPRTARQVAAIVDQVGMGMVDGGIVGPPAWQHGSTRLALSGGAEDVATVAGVFAGSPLETVVVGDSIGAASAFKAGFAAWTKGSSALLLAIAAFARAEGVDDALHTEWRTRAMGLDARLDGSRAAVVPKAWRFGGEMREIAAAWSDAGLPAGVFDGFGAVYDRLAEAKDANDVPMEDVMEMLISTEESPS